jgi:hypothetical protein
MNKAELILRARQKKTAGDFKRQLTNPTPVDLQFDTYELSCGHTVGLLASVGSHVTVIDCSRCAEEWLAKATGDADESK